MNILKILAKFARIRVTLMLFALTFIGGASGGEISVKIAFVFPLLIVWYIHATTTNDYADYEIDKINLGQEKDRPLLTNNLSRAGLWRIHTFALFATLLLSLQFGVRGLLLTIGLLTINYIYSLRPFRISDRGILAQYLLAVAYVYYPLSLGYWTSQQTYPYPWIMSAGLFCAFVARLLLKDYRDVKGDKKHGKKTFLIRHGSNVTVITSTIFWLLSAALISFYTSFDYGIMIPSLLGLAQGYLLLRVLEKTNNTHKQQKCITFIAKAANGLIIVLLAYLLSRNQASLSNSELIIIPLVTGIVLLAYNWLRYVTAE